MSSCPDDDQYARMLQGRLPPREVAALERHLDECAACTELVAHLGKVFSPSVPPRAHAESELQLSESEPKLSEAPLAQRLIALELCLALTHGVWTVILAGVLAPASAAGLATEPQTTLPVVGLGLFVALLVWAPLAGLLSVTAVAGLFWRKPWARGAVRAHAIICMPSLVLAPLAWWALRELRRTA